MAAHAENSLAAGVHFIPLVLESFGGWGRDLIETVKTLGRLQAQKVSISLCRDIAALWLARQPSFPPAVDSLL